MVIPLVGISHSIPSQSQAVSLAASAAAAQLVGRFFLSRVISGLGNLLSYIPGSGLVKGLFTYISSLFTKSIKPKDKEVIKALILAHLNGL